MVKRKLLYEIIFFVILCLFIVWNKVDEKVSSVVVFKVGEF